MGKYLITYDISDEKRVVRFAKKLEKLAMRLQYSVFYIECVKKELIEIECLIDEMINVEEDDVRIYQIKDSVYTLGKAYEIDEIFLN
ncbi:MAG: CRISPR-associated endonuclease Cas2 [Campylobacterales bacterium]|nr:CRISPR-associated endonuclease Cas2 [Campylobacterales bacterium]